MFKISELNNKCQPLPWCVANVEVFSMSVSVGEYVVLMLSRICVFIPLRFLPVNNSEIAFVFVSMKCVQNILNKNAF